MGKPGRLSVRGRMAPARDRISASTGPPRLSLPTPTTPATVIVVQSEIGVRVITTIGSGFPITADSTFSSRNASLSGTSTAISIRAWIAGTFFDPNNGGNDGLVAAILACSRPAICRPQRPPGRKPTGAFGSLTKRLIPALPVPTRTEPPAPLDVRSPRTHPAFAQTASGGRRCHGQRRPL